MEKTWFDSCYRKLFLDYHLQQSATGVGKNFDGKDWAEKLAKAGVQGVNCFAKCAFGWRYYQKGNIGKLHPNLPKGMDLLEDTIRECHKKDIKVIAYYHTFGSEYIAKLHPEWLVTDKNGEKSFRDVCLLTPIVKEELLPQVKEIAENYDIDGMFFDGTSTNGSVCYCESCQKRYKAETGFNLPSSKEDKGYADYMKWSMQAHNKLRQEIIDTVASVNKKALVTINWCYSPRQVEEPPENIGFLSIDIGPANMLSYASLVARFWALTGKPFDVMNHMALKWWLEWGVKPINSLKQESAVILANGGKTWVGYQMYPEYGVAPYLFETLKENFDFVKRIEPVIENAEIFPYVGVLHGEKQIHEKNDGGFLIYADESSLEGIHRALTFSGIHYNSCYEQVFLSHLSQFKAVILSGGQPLSPKVTTAVEEYVKNGGKLLVTGKTGFVDEKYNFIQNETLENLIGGKISNNSPYNHGYLVLPQNSIIGEKTPEMPMLSSRPFTVVTPTTAQVLGTSRGIYLRADGKPMFNELQSRTTFSPPGEDLKAAAILKNNYGKGTVVYIATDIFSSYAGGSQWYFKNLTKNIFLQLLLKEEGFELDCPGYSELSIMKKDNDMLLHLTNLVREWPASGFGEAIEYVIGEDVLPIHDIKLRLPIGMKPSAITTLDGTACETEIVKGRVVVNLKKLDIHEVIILKEVSY